MKEKYNTYKNPFCWTEDNRLQAVKDDKMGAFYNYDASGERNLKLSGGTMNVTQNGYTMNVPVLDEQTLYASALVTINDKGYTKHYFEEGKRICSKIGSGGFHHTLSLSTPIEGDYKDIHDHRSIGGVIKIFDMCMGLEPRIKNEDIYQKVIKPYAGQINPDEPVFYYHSDHLGSASYITDDVGDPTQHLVYLPFGEDWVDMKYNTSQFDTPYKFNGKEKDPETGLHYYGARYLNTDLSIWLSVDPMSDKYPHLTSYNYCANNPVMLVDPDGREMDGYYNLQGSKIFDDKNGSDNKKLVITNKKEISSLEGEQYMNVPTNESLGKMERMYDKDLEKGMLVGEDGNTSQIVTGSRNEITNDAWNPAKLEISLENVAYTIHSHSENQDDGGFGLAIPSQKDKNSFIGTTKIGVVLGYQEGQVKNSITGKTGLNKTIGFFTKEGSILNEPKSFSDFKTAIYKINKQ